MNELTDELYFSATHDTTMKICFFWVEKFRNLRNFGLNMDSSQTFRYDRDANRISRTPLAPLPANFFPPVIADVAAVVGQNGVGKSNVLELLCRLLKGSKSANFDFLLIYEDGKDMHCCHRFRKVEQPDSEFRMRFHDEIHDNLLRVIFYSNVHTDRQRSLGSGVVDLSPDQPIRNALEHDERKTVEFQKQIWFMNADSGFGETGIQPPTHVEINVARGPLDPGRARHEPGPLQVFRRASARIRDRIRRIEPQRRLATFLTLIFFSRILTKTYKLLEEKETGDSLLRQLNKLIEMSEVIPPGEICVNLLGYLDKYVPAIPADMAETRTSSGIKRPGLGNLARNLKYLWRLVNVPLDFKFEQSDAEFRNMDIVTFQLEFFPRSREWLIELLDNFRGMQLFSVNWTGISSGQRAYLSLFSLIAYELSRTKDDFVFLAIDEGDLYLHPMWQVEFFSRLLDVLQRAYKGKVQLLLTSHSPFLLADLPRQNFTVLSALEAAELENPALQRETFGGNLYDLYAGPLFIDTLKTSLFAQQKLREMAAKARVRPMPASRKQELMDQTRLIGDDIVKNLIIRDLND